MYDTKEDLLAVLNPDTADKLAQRAMKLIAETRKLARDAIVKENDEVRERVEFVYFDIGLVVMATHHIKNYKFVADWIAAQPEDMTDVDPFQLLPIIVNMPDLEEAEAIMDMSEHNFKELRPLVEPARLS